MAPTLLLSATFYGHAIVGTMGVSFEGARAMYWAAYEAYRACAARVAKVIAAGDVPSGADIHAEERAQADLTTARRQLMDAMAKQR